MAVSTFDFTIVNATPPNITREALKTSHMTTVGYHTYIAAQLIEGGEATVVIQFDPGAEPPMDQPAETFTMTFPNGETWQFDGFLTGYAGSADLETVMQATVTIKVADDITISS